jgi:hypothetical protein
MNNRLRLTPLVDNLLSLPSGAISYQMHMLDTGPFGVARQCPDSTAGGHR